MTRVGNISAQNVSTVEGFSQKEIRKKPCVEELTRDEWNKSSDFFFSALGYVVGLGNIWRHPYLVLKNGGGAFLIPFFICLIILGIPLVYLEMIVGQFTSQGPLTAWKMVKLTKGIGFTINIANTLMIIYYNMVLAYCLYYMITSIRIELPWTKCMPDFASPNCVDDFSSDKYFFTKCQDSLKMLKCDDPYNMGRCFNATTLNGTIATCDTNRHLLEQIGWWKTSFPSQDFWNKHVLQKSSGIDDIGSFNFPLFSSLFGAWLMIYFIVYKGIKISGQLALVTAVFPYVVLITLAIRCLFLPGFEIGLKFYVTPQWDKLIQYEVWCDAAVQTFFTLSCSYGGLNTLSSYNNFRQNIMRDAILISIINFLTSLLAGFVIFGFMGYLSSITHQDLTDIFQSGQGLAFVVYPYALTTIKGAPIWSFIFFLMMITLGIDTSMGSVETSITCILDFFPSLRKVQFKRCALVNSVFLFYFICGVIFCFGNGIYLMNWCFVYVGDWAILLGGFLECIIVAWFYGLRNFQKDIDCMLGEQKSYVKYTWWILWGFITPVTCLTITIITLANIKMLTFDDYEFPKWSLVLGILLTSSSIVGFFGWMLYEIFDTLFVKKKHFWTLIKPDFEAYQPEKEENRKLVRIARGLEAIKETSMIDKI